MPGWFAGAKYSFGHAQLVCRSKVLIWSCPAGLQETERLLGEVEEVNRTLTYIRAVVQQEKLEILPRSATLILDTVMNVFNTLRNTPAASNRYSSSCCSSLLPHTAPSLPPHTAPSLLPHTTPSLLPHTMPSLRPHTTPSLLPHTLV